MTSTDALIRTLPKWNRPVAWFIKNHEKESGVSHIRFAQDVSTNWVPKALLARSTADFAEMTFLEYTESALFYYAPALFGENVARKHVFSKFLPENLRKHVAEPFTKLKNDPSIKKEDLKRILPVKAAIVLSCAFIPAAEYAVSFAKNLFTLKFFKKSDFSNIANLNKDQTESKEQQNRVKQSANKNIKRAGLVALAGFAASGVFAVFGHKSKGLQTASEYILNFGSKTYSAVEKAGFKSPKLKNALEKYTNLDFANNNGKLCLSVGQLTASVITGVAGYFMAAKDRGKLDFMEVATRVPPVALYIILGSSFLEGRFIKYLHKNKYFPNLLTKEKGAKDIKTLKFEELQKKSEELAKKHGTSVNEEWKKLFKGKAVTTLGPFLFSLVVMGFTVAGITRYWTQYRYNNGTGQIRTDLSNNTDYFAKNPSDKTFKSFKRHL